MRYQIVVTNTRTGESSVFARNLSEQEAMRDVLVVDRYLSARVEPDTTTMQKMPGQGLNGKPAYRVRKDGVSLGIVYQKGRSWEGARYEDTDSGTQLGFMPALYRTRRAAAEAVVEAVVSS